MKKTVIVFASVLSTASIGLSQPNDSSNDQEILNSKSKLSEALIKEFSNDNIHWEKYGNNSQICYLRINDQKYSVMSTNNEDLSKIYYVSENSNKSSLETSVLVFNQTHRRKATVEEIINLLNWQSLKGFYWNEEEHLNRAPQCYSFVLGEIFEISFKKFLKNPEQVIGDLLNNVDSTSSECYISNVYCQSKDSIFLAYCIHEKNILFFIQNNSCEEITTRFYKGTGDMAYTGLKIPPLGARLVFINARRINISDTEVVSSITRGCVGITHIGERLIQ